MGDSSFADRRIGIINVSIDLINKTPNIVNEIFLHCIPVDAKHDFVTGAITYTAIGSAFEEVPKGMVIPEYTVEYDSEKMTMEFKKL